MQQQLDPPARSVSNTRNSRCIKPRLACWSSSQGGRIVSVPGSSSDPLQSIQGTNDSHSRPYVMIIRSPVIVEQALASAGLRNLPTETMIDCLSVTLPDPEAKILQIDYKAKVGTEDEAVKIVKLIMRSCDKLSEFNYQNISSDIIYMIIKDRDELSEDLQRLEREYLEFRQQSPAYSADKDGRSFVIRRLDQWDQAANQTLIRALQLQSQLELGWKLAGEGTSAAAIAHALSQLGGMAGNANIAPTLPEVGGPPDLSDERLEAELDNVEFQRLTATRLLDRLRAEQATSASSCEVGDEEVTHASLAEDLRRHDLRFLTAPDRRPSESRSATDMATATRPTGPCARSGAIGTRPPAPGWNQPMGQLITQPRDDNSPTRGCWGVPGRSRF
jgi:hypothetical protein